MKTSDLFLLSAQMCFVGVMVLGGRVGPLLFWGFICGALAVVTMHRENREIRRETDL